MVRKLIAAGTIVFCAAASAPAAPPSVIVDTNIILGLNLCKFEGKALGTDFDLKAGLIGGAFWSVYLADFFGVQAGISYTQKGGILKQAISTGTLRSKLAFSYLEVPLVAKIGYLPRSEPGFRIYALGGASFGLKLSSRIILDVVQEGIETPVDSAKLEGYKGGVFNGVAGAGFEFAVKGGGLLFLEGRYSRSLATISNEGNDQRFTVFSVMAGYSF